MPVIKRKKRVSKNKKTRILKAVASGTPVKTVAEKNNIHVTTIHNWMRQASIPSVRARRKQVERPTKRAYVRKVEIKSGLTKLPEDIKQIVLKALSDKYGIDLT